MKSLKQSKHVQAFKEVWTYYRGWKWLIFLALFISLILSSYLVLLAKTTSVETLKDALQNQTTIYSQDDVEVGILNAGKGTYVPLDQISTYMQDTVVNTEDKRFYSHNGFDAKGIGRALFRLVINRNTSGGGGSTLTQQLAKNAFLSQDQTLQRKFKELFLALEIEKVYEKSQILEMYLNHAYFGNGVWGVEDASWKYFGHPSSELNWNESMVLTGILKGPSVFNPIDDYDAAIERRNVINDLLLKEGILSQEEHQFVFSSGIPLFDNYYGQDNYTYPHYFDAVINEAIAKTHIPEADLIGNGYKIYTHLNPSYQDALNQSYQAGGIFPEGEEDQPIVQSASVVMNPKNGGVQAVYGGRGEYTYRGFNRATDMRRSPGSTIKPLAVYVPALEKGYHMHSTVPDKVETYNGYTPENYDRQTEPNGETQLYYALAQSKNTTAVHLMDELGIDKSIEKLKQFGIPLQAEDKSLTLALGALYKGVSVMEMANAYSAFANDGIRYQASFIRRIEDASGKEIYNNEHPAKYMVMTKNISRDMTSMMLDTFGGQGTGYGAGPNAGMIAGKTGSTEINEENMEARDKWMIGYTPDFVVATWVGMDEVGDQVYQSSISSLFNLQTSYLMANSPQTPFEVTYASAMSDNHNHVSDVPWEDEWGPKLDRFFQDSRRIISVVWDEAKSLGQDVMDGAKDLWRQVAP